MGDVMERAHDVDALRFVFGIPGRSASENCMLTPQTACSFTLMPISSAIFTAVTSTGVYVFVITQVMTT